ncbi:hypothetical protein DL93DRAFT_2069813 [Clavulina sp. PMI_390]|nr:hypothetical protein DL93DRAFT_2069813 [Clavulina sp. PMI_390]
MEEGPEIQSYLLSKTGQRTVPSVWIHGQHIGGNDDFQSANRIGKVKKLLAEKP